MREVVLEFKIFQLDLLTSLILWPVAIPGKLWACVIPTEAGKCRSVC